MDSQSKTFRLMANLKGFTLVELLVVIAVIAMLLSILMPALSKGRHQAKFVVCRSNLKQINLAAIMWSRDNDDWVLPATWDRNPMQGQTKSGYRLNPYLGAEAQGKNIYICPANNKSSGGPIPPTNQFYSLFSSSMTAVLSSYGINEFLCMATNNGPGSPSSSAGGTWGPGGVYFYEHGNTRSLAIRNPRTAIYFIDCAIGISWPKIYSDEYFPSVSQIEKGRRHLIKGSRANVGKANIAWCDGSASREPDDFEIKTPDRKGDIITVNERYFRGN